jgi:hypothetical protein
MFAKGIVNIPMSDEKVRSHLNLRLRQVLKYVIARFLLLLGARTIPSLRYLSLSENLAGEALTSQGESGEQKESKARLASSNYNTRHHNYSPNHTLF